jgi:hypothetical protein
MQIFTFISYWSLAIHKSFFIIKVKLQQIYHFAVFCFQSVIT